MVRRLVRHGRRKRLSGHGALVAEQQRRRLLRAAVDPPHVGPPGPRTHKLRRQRPLRRRRGVEPLSAAGQRPGPHEEQPRRRSPPGTVQYYVGGFPTRPRLWRSGRDERPLPSRRLLEWQRRRSDRRMPDAGTHDLAAADERPDVDSFKRTDVVAVPDSRAVAEAVVGTDVLSDAPSERLPEAIAGADDARAVVAESLRHRQVPLERVPRRHLALLRSGLRRDEGRPLVSDGNDDVPRPPRTHLRFLSLGANPSLDRCHFRRGTLYHPLHDDVPTGRAEAVLRSPAKSRDYAVPLRFLVVGAILRRRERHLRDIHSRGRDFVATDGDDAEWPEDLLRHLLRRPRHVAGRLEAALRLDRRGSGDDDAKLRSRHLAVALRQRFLGHVRADDDAPSDDLRVADALRHGPAVAAGARSRTDHRQAVALAVVPPDHERPVGDASTLDQRPGPLDQRLRRLLLLRLRGLGVVPARRRTGPARRGDASRRLEGRHRLRERDRRPPHQRPEPSHLSLSGRRRLPADLPAVRLGRRRPGRREIRLPAATGHGRHQRRQRLLRRRRVHEFRHESAVHPHLRVHLRRDSDGLLRDRVPDGHASTDDGAPDDALALVISVESTDGQPGPDDPRSDAVPPSGSRLFLQRLRRDRRVWPAYGGPRPARRCDASRRMEG
mmetsp:Transcript_3576/g.11724  ORF Transcript_3576/g.11724 Transcript_3576/m.11724 type:complete len:664 (-) Transcript_3576:1748-3739(-)